MTGMTDQLVAPLRTFGKDDLPLAGGKGANLGELIQHGFPVPDGFLVTTQAYATIASGTDLAATITELVAGRLATGDDDGAKIRAGFETAAIPDGLRAALVEAYARLGRVPVAVRSSATAEDLPGAAFAGQQDTYLNVVGEEALLDAVRRCWGSLWTDRAIAYRRRRGIDSDEVRIAVVVQAMVQADTAGVMFTANPVTGERGEIVIDASEGLGEAVVSGLVTPDHYVLDPDGKVREWSPGRREVVIRGTSGGGVTHEEGQGQSTAKPQRLPAGVLEELARLGTSVAEHFGRPQDIEWAYADRRVWLVQARPMTAVPPPPLRLNAVQRRLGSVLLDYVPVRPYPIDVTTWVPYGPAGLMGKIAESFGFRGALDGFLREEDGVVVALVPPSPTPTIGVLAVPFRIAARARRHDPDRWTEDPRFTEWIRRISDVAGHDLATMPWSELIQVPRQALTLVEPAGDLRADYLPRAVLALGRLAVALKVLRRGDLLNDLILGAHTRTHDANLALEALAAQVRETPRLAGTFATLEPHQLMDAIEGDPEFGAFAAALEAFLVEYGHRETASPILVSPPTLGESPETVLGLVKVLASKPPSPRTAGPAEVSMERLLTHPLLRASGIRAPLLRWVEAARAGLAFREDSHFYFTKPLPILRRALLEIGGRLRDAGILAAPEDVFHLRLEELEAITELPDLDEAYAEKLRAGVRARSAKREELAGVRLIDPTLVFPTPPDSGDALVVGAPGGGGRITGPVRVIREAAEFGQLASGDVLVCPYTNPAWTPLFQRAAAVVVDSGGIASHAAIVAREYGIPAVMGTARGTGVLTNGQLVTVDGNTGRVTSASASASDDSDRP
ncbi:PEP/pyruvate-binding domain-containing protein [Actinopolymorpha alba]|uniref:PEP/pyruvate-binding domain-containing protein n=1 Tax=Actinopolymorpha alba TaxID=533267 RepID=UPI00039B2AC7|nr:PEP/pyruvate-binding domain-containing protein [Actinopolymorpha alba]